MDFELGTWLTRRHQASTSSSTSCTLSKHWASRCPSSLDDFGDNAFLFLARCRSLWVSIASPNIVYCCCPCGQGDRGNAIFWFLVISSNVGILDVTVTDRHVTHFVLTCSAVAQQCVKAHMQSQWRKPKLDPPVKSEPLKFSR